MTHRKHPKTRVVTFYVRGVDECKARDMIAPSIAAGTISEWGSDAAFVWFQGKPGAELRAVRDLLVSHGGQSVPLAKVDERLE